MTRAIWIALALIAGLILACALDVPIARLTAKDGTNAFEKQDVARMLRIGGFLPTWWIVALAMILQARRPKRGETCDWPSAFRAGGWALAVATTSAGIWAEVIKLFLRRRRPADPAVWYDFRAFGEQTFNTGGLSMPSSHAIVAFAAAFTLWRVFPGARWVFMAIALGTAFTRIQAGAHYVSDVYVAALVAWFCAWVTWRWFPLAR